MYATMIACAFASCSKDEDGVDVGGGNGEANATLEVQLVGPTTKAMPAQGVDAEIKNLALVVFNAGVVETVGTADGEAGAGKAVKTGGIKPGNKEIIVLANVGKGGITDGMSKADVLALTRTIENETAANGFSMNSAVIPVTVAASGTTYVGYDDGEGKAEQASYQRVGAPVKLYRNVARIHMNTVVKGAVNATQYPSAAINITKVFVLHGHNKTTLVGSNGAEWGATDWSVAKANTAPANYVNGAANETYAKWVKYMVDGSFTKVYQYITTPTLYTPIADGDYERVIANKEAIASGDVAPFYTYENTEANQTDDNFNTLLVVQADFSYTGLDKNGNSTTITEAGRFYPIAVGYGSILAELTADYNGLRGAAAGAAPVVSGVLRNLKYVVNLTITGPGYETPFGPKPDGGNPGGEGGDTFMDAKVRVVDFGTVTQEETVE